MNIADVWNSTGMPEDEFTQPIEISMALAASLTFELAVFVDLSVPQTLQTYASRDNSTKKHSRAWNSTSNRVFPGARFIVGAVCLPQRFWGLWVIFPRFQRRKSRCTVVGVDVQLHHVPPGIGTFSNDAERAKMQ